MYNLFWLLIFTEIQIGNIREKYILLKYSVLMRIQLVPSVPIINEIGLFEELN